MHILFVDESGSAPEADKATSQPFFVLGGIVIPEDIWAKMAADLARVKAHYAIEGEIKWRNFAPDKGGNPHALSHLSVGIQFADMVAGAVFRAFKAQDARFADQIKESFRTSPSGVIEGFGLVKLPKVW